MRLIGIAVALVLLTVPARADQSWPHTDIVCSRTANTALVRFAFSSDSDPPVYARLPEKLDGGLSRVRGTDRTDCLLPNGLSIRIRDGAYQAFGYGLGGGDPPGFFSLWIGKRKVLSRYVWKPGYEDSFSHKPMLDGLLITPKTLTFCSHGYGDDGPISCRAQSFDLARYAKDDVEYPATPDNRGPVGTVYVDAESTDHTFCQHRLSAVKRTAHYDGWDDGRQFIDDISVPQPAPSGGVPSLGAVPGDFANLPARRAYRAHGEDHYFDGDIVVLVPKSTSDAKVRAYLAGDDLEKTVAQVPPSGWTVIAGGAPFLYPSVDARYVHLNPEQIGGALYLLAYPTSDSEVPSAILLKLLPSGKTATVCVFNQVQPHY